MIQITSEFLYQLLASHLLPLARILGIFSSAPLFSNRSITGSIRVALGVAISLLIAPTLAPVQMDLLSWQGLLAIIQQVVIGITLGFCMRLVFTAVEFAGELMGMTMGFGFATFFDPQSQGRNSSISQLLTALLLLVFIGSDLHLLFLEALTKSFVTLPISEHGFDANQYRSLAYLGSYIFLSGLHLSLPVVTALLIINTTLGILTRAAPQLNLFGIGFPVTLSAGFIMLYATLPYWSLVLSGLLRQGLEHLDNIIQ